MNNMSLDKAICPWVSIRVITKHLRVIKETFLRIVFKNGYDYKDIKGIITLLKNDNKPEESPAKEVKFLEFSKPFQNSPLKCNRPIVKWVSDYLIIGAERHYFFFNILKNAALRADCIVTVNAFSRGDHNQ